MKKVFTLLVFLTLSGSVFAEKLSRIESRNYEKLTSFVKTLGEKFTVKVIGTVTTSDSEKLEYPIYKITYKNPTSAEKRKLLFLAGMHGNEPAPVFAMKDLIQTINSGKIKMPLNTKIDFIFVMNPYGFERNYRFCSNHTDPNRDLKSQTTQEMKILTAATDEKYDLVIDFHEATCDGTFLYAYDKKGKKAAKKILELLKLNGVKLENEYVDVVLKVEDGLLYSPFYAQMYLKMKGSETTGMYFHDKNVPVVFTVETPKRGNFDTRCQIIRMIAGKVFQDSFIE